MVAELVPNQLSRRRIVAGCIDRASLNERDTLPSVHDVQRLAFHGGGILSDWTGVAPEDFETVEIDALFDKTRRLLPHLSNPLACGAVEAVNRAPAAQIDLPLMVS